MTETKLERALNRYRFALDVLHDGSDDSDAMTNLISDGLITAENAVMSAPATNFDDLRVKADVLFADHNSVPRDDHVKSFFADLIRMTGNGPSRVFDPARWLARFERIGGGWVVQEDRTWLMWPEDDRMDDCLQELELRGGKPAVLDLIRARHNGQEA